MKFWFSGELQRDIAKDCRKISENIETILNKELAEKTYGAALEEIAFLPVIMEYESTDFPEVIKYHKKDKSAEFRLKILHSKFKLATFEEKEALFKSALMRAVVLLREAIVKGIDFERIELDVRRCLEKSGPAQ